jgi:predicted RNA binding protein YcfA (HicA-like mRNA interferase family)
MSQWGACKAKHLYRALLKRGWTLKREAKGSHRILQHEGCSNFVFSFHDGEEIGPRMLSRIAKQTGLEPNDL